MADIDLTQEEADALIAMPKNRANDDKNIRVLSSQRQISDNSLDL